MTKAIMIQGAGSNVGKSLVVAGLARAFYRRGLKTRPFKPQNMSNNAAVTLDGGEIGRAQALQARACGLAPHTDMNPVLLKPESETGAQVIVQGRRWKTLRAREYNAQKQALMAPVLESFHRLACGADIIVVEGAGSPAETNLRTGDIANMGFAEAADIPVILVGDIDRGGVIAQLAGSALVLSESDRNRIKGFLVNKFRGDVTLFDEGVATIEDHTGWPGLGVLPWFPEAALLPAEDILDIQSNATVNRDACLVIAVPRLNRIANFDDLDPLSGEPQVDVRIIDAGQPLPGDADLVLIPGSKSTISDLRHFRAQGWDIDLRAHIRRGGHVLGICGGYQMLGRKIHDPDGIEGPPGSSEGLGVLDVETTMKPEKHLREVSATWVETGTALQGYEIHLGETRGPDCDRGLIAVGGRVDGARSTDGRAMGCYLHGMFASDRFRSEFLAGLGGRHSGLNWSAAIDATLDRLAAHLEASLDVDQILALAGEIAPNSQDAPNKGSS